MEFSEGFFYEQEATGFLSLKALKDADDFWLISNASICSPLDGTILCTKIQDRNVIHIFQVFHKRNPKKILDNEFTYYKKKSRFSIESFYENVRDTVDKVKEIIPQSYKENCKFKYIFFTNRRMQDNSEIFNEVTDEGIFTTINGKMHNFKSEFVMQEKNLDRRNFLKDFYLFANQCDLQTSSVDSIAEMTNAEYKTAENIKLAYFHCIENWFAMLTDKYSLNKLFNRKLFMYAIEKNFGIPLNNYAAHKKVHSVLKNENLNLLWETIKNNNKTISSCHIQYILGKILEDLEQLQGDNEVYKYLEKILYSDNLMRNKEQLKYHVECLLGRMPFVLKDFNLTIPEGYLKHIKVVFVDSSNKNLGNFNKEELNPLKAINIAGKNGEI